MLTKLFTPGFLNRKRVLHYADIFLASFGVTLIYEREQILGAHGLSALGSIVFAICVVAGKAVIEAYRKTDTTPTSPGA